MSITETPSAATAAPQTPQPPPALAEPTPGEAAWAVLERAVHKAELDMAAFAGKLGIRRQAITGWRVKTLRLGKLWIPAARVLDAERILKPHLPKERMRPDLYRRSRRRP